MTALQSSPVWCYFVLKCFKMLPVQFVTLHKTCKPKPSINEQNQCTLSNINPRIMVSAGSEFTKNTSWDYHFMACAFQGIGSSIWYVIRHVDIIKWKHFQRYWPFVGGIHRWPVDSSHKGQWREALMFSLICTWTNGWANTRGVGDFRRYSPHYAVTVTLCVLPTKYAHGSWFAVCCFVWYCPVVPISFRVISLTLWYKGSSDLHNVLPPPRNPFKVRPRRNPSHCAAEIIIFLIDFIGWSDIHICARVIKWHFK